MTTPGKPKIGEMTMLNALQAAVGKSKRQIQNILQKHPTAEGYSDWDRAVRAFQRAAKRVIKHGDGRTSERAKALLDAAKRADRAWVRPNPAGFRHSGPRARSSTLRPLVHVPLVPQYTECRQPSESQGTVTSTQSVNFGFLAEHDPLLVRLAAQTEGYVFTDSETALFKLRQWVEVLAKQIATVARVPDAGALDLLGLLRRLPRAQPRLKARSGGHAMFSLGKPEMLQHTEMP